MGESIEHTELDRYYDKGSLVNELNNPSSRMIMMLFSHLQDYVFNPIRFSEDKQANFINLIQNIESEQSVKEDFVFDQGFVLDLINLGLLNQVNSIEKFNFKGSNDKISIVDGVKVFYEDGQVNIGLKARTIEILLRHSFKKLEDLDLKKALAKLRSVPCQHRRIQHDFFDIRDGYFVISPEVTGFIRNSLNCYLYWYLEKIKNDVYYRYNTLNIDILNLIRVFGNIFVQDKSIKRFSQYPLSKDTDYIGNTYIKNDVLTIKTRLQNSVNLKTTDKPFDDWISDLNSLIYTYLDVQRFSSIFSILIESITKQVYLPIYDIEIENQFESPESFVSFMDSIAKGGISRIQFSEELSDLYEMDEEEISSFYRNSLKIVKIADNILNFLHSEHDLSKVLNSKEDYIALNKKIF